MNFTHYDLGNRTSGEIVEVTLSGNAANVRLMDSLNFQNYRNGKKHRYFGGHTTKSPIRLAIPSSGHWHVAVDMGGYNGSVKSAIRLLPGALPTFRETPLSSVPSLVQRHEELPQNGSDEYKNYDVFTSHASEDKDVFISHASEDKEDIVRPLAYALQHSGLSVWFDEFELRIGDSLRRKIDRGLSRSRFGIIVLSQVFFTKGWTNYELDGLVTRAITGEQVLLPIWHNVTKQEVINYSPSLADKVARSTATHTVEEIAQEIAELIKGENKC